MGKECNKMAVIPCLQTFFLIFNVVFWATVSMLFMIALWVDFSLYKYMELSPEFLGTVSYVMIGIACFIVVSAIGFSWVIKGKPVLLNMYGGVLAVICVLNAGLGASVVCRRDVFAKNVRDGLTETITNNNPHKTEFDFAQKNFQCCGVSNYTDWIRLSPQKVIPISCCLNPDNCVTANYNDVWQRGCYEMITEYLDNNIDLVKGFAIASAILPLVGTFLSCFLASYIKKRRYKL